MKLAITVLTLSWVLISTTVAAQEPQDEIVAQVNSDVVSRSALVGRTEELQVRLRNEMYGKSDAEFEAEFGRQKERLLDTLIDELLLDQKARELGIDVEAEVNQQMLRVMAEQNFKTMAELEQAMREVGFNPEELRSTLRKDFQRQIVIQREVLQPLGMNAITTEHPALRQYLKKLRESAYIQIS